MKLLFILCSLCGLALAAIIGASLISRQNQVVQAPAPAQQVFHAKGRIFRIEADRQTVHIAHEEIPGYMPAMSMPFTVKDPVVLAGLVAGDKVSFDLIATKDDSWVTRIEKRSGAAAVSSSSVGTPAASDTSAATPVLQSGRLVPDFELINQKGQAFRLSDFRGQAVVLTFIYTRCPLPNYCPLMSKNFAELQTRFAKEFPGRVQLLSISFDPQFDTPPVLKQYAQNVSREDGGWTFATGTTNQIDFVTGLFGLYREPVNGLINHDLRTALISPDGHLVHVWRSNVWTPYEVQRMVRETLQPALAKH